MKIAIIGANGFIGTRLVEMLHLSGIHTVVPVVRRASGLALSARFALDWRIGDALDLASLSLALAGCDAVVHTALGDPQQIKTMPKILCAAAAAAGIKRVVYLSSASVHGQAPAKGTTEETPLSRRHEMDYNTAKVIAEGELFAQGKRLGLDGFALRPGVVYGPRSRWISDLAADLRQHRAWLFDEGAGIFNGIYVDNLIEAIVRALEAPANAAGAYLVGDAERVTWSEFYHAAAQSFGLPTEDIHRIFVAPMFKRSRREQISRLIAGRTVQSVLPMVPSRVKTMTKRLLAAEPVAGNSWQLRQKARPRITQELVLLQQCQWKLPSDRATQLLGYKPVVDFPTAIHRSAAWLAFAEGNA